MEALKWRGIAQQTFFILTHHIGRMDNNTLGRTGFQGPREEGAHFRSGPVLAKDTE